MEYNKATLEGRGNLWLIGQIEKAIIKIASEKPKQDRLTYTSLEKISDLSSMRMGIRSTKRAKMCEVKKYDSGLEKLIFKVIFILRNKLKSLKCSLIFS